MDYKAAAEVWLQEKEINPDGWYHDPEAIAALEEAMFDAEQRGEDPLGPARNQWRNARDIFKHADGRLFRIAAAGEMVAIEKMVAEKVK